MSHTEYGLAADMKAYAQVGRGQVVEVSSVHDYDAQTAAKRAYVDQLSKAQAVDVTPLQATQEDMTRQIGFLLTTVTNLANKMGNAGLLRPPYEAGAEKSPSAPAPIRSPLEDWLVDRTYDIRRVESYVQDLLDRSVY